MTTSGSRSSTAHFVRSQRRAGAALRTLQPAGGTASCRQGARLTVVPVTVYSTGSSVARRPAPAGDDRRPPGGLRVAAMGRLPPYSAASPTRRSQQTTRQRTRAIPHHGVGPGKPDKWLVPAPPSRSPIGVAPCGPVSGRPIRAITIIKVLLKRVGPLWQSAAWALDRSETGPGRRGWAAAGIGRWLRTLRLR